CVRSVRSAGYEPLRDEFHAAAGLQGARFDPRSISLGARSRRFRGSLLLPRIGSSCDRRWRKCVDGGNRGADRALRPVFGTARAIDVGTVRDQRDAQGRWRGPRGVERESQTSCRNYRDGGVRRSWPQVSDLGAWPFPKRARAGHRKGASAQGRVEFPGGGAKRARGTGMMAGGGG